VVDAPLHDEDAIRLEQLARRHVHRVEDDRLCRARHVVEPQEHHRLALLRRRLADGADDAADRDDVAVAPPLELDDRAVGLAPERVLDRVERMLGHVQSERLLLVRKAHVLVPLLGGDRRMLLRPALGLLPAAEVEDGALARQAVGLLAPAPRERLLEHVEHPAP
jgi:hypothetical protein